MMYFLFVCFFQTSCREDSREVNTSITVAPDLSSKHFKMTMDNHKSDAKGASQQSNGDFEVHSKGRNKQFFSNNFTYLTKQPSDNNQETIGAKLEDDPELYEEVEKLWDAAEGIMGNKYDETLKVLEVYGIREGEEDSETEEGQLWRMVQGNAPYTLNLV